MTSQQVSWWTIDQHVASILDTITDWPPVGTPAWNQLPDNDIRKKLIHRGRTIIQSGEHTPPRGEYLGTIDHWGLDVHENSPHQWIDTLLAEEH